MYMERKEPSTPSSRHLQCSGSPVSGGIRLRQCRPYEAAFFTLKPAIMRGMTIFFVPATVLVWGGVRGAGKEASRHHSWVCFRVLALLVPETLFPSFLAEE